MSTSTIANRSPPLLALAVTALLVGPLSWGYDVEPGRRMGWRELSGSSQPVVRTPADLDVNPVRGQSQQRLEVDLNECHKRAVAAAGYDPNHASTGFQVGQKRLDYDHALSACLENRGYTVK
jgi:hypothetical protein